MNEVKIQKPKYKLFDTVYAIWDNDIYKLLIRGYYYDVREFNYCYLTSFWCEDLETSLNPNKEIEGIYMSEDNLFKNKKELCKYIMNKDF
jgi:hypothetical protein